MPPKQEQRGQVRITEFHLMTQAFYFSTPPSLTDALEAVEKLQTLKGRRKQRFIQKVATRLGMTPLQLLQLAETYSRGDRHD